MNGINVVFDFNELLPEKCHKIIWVMVDHTLILLFRYKTRNPINIPDKKCF